MKRKGFTLIELLAVIVILALIAVILAPVVMNLIGRAKKSSTERSADNYLRAVETAIATERIEGPIVDGEYEVDVDGNLVLGETTIKVDVNGDKPEAGSKIKISNGLVDKANTTLTISGYSLTYNEELKEFEAVESNTNSVMYSLEYIKGQTEDDIIKYDPVANSKCTTGDTCYSWYVLEDGDTTELVNGDGSLHYENANPGYGTAGPREVSLIMNQNIDNTTVKWCISGTDRNCNAAGARKHLTEQTSNWTVDVDLPTYAQIKAANGGSTSNLPIWLYDYLHNTTHSVSNVRGYWTSTARKAFSTDAWSVYSGGGLYGYKVDIGSVYGVRPVITISKTKLG